MRSERILESSNELVDGMLRRRIVIELVEEIQISPRILDPFDLGLTRREQNVFELIRLSNKEIAQILNLSERTIKFYVSALLKKTGTKGRLELYALSLRQKQNTPNRAA